MKSSPEGWRRLPIRHVYLNLYDGPHATPAPSDDGPVFLGIGNITEEGHLDLTTVRHIAEADFGKWTKRVTPRSGDIVFTYEATLNRYAIIPDGFRGCLGRRLALIRPNPDVVDTRFLHYSFFGADWRETISEQTLAGSTVDRIPLIKFPNFPINIPPLATQRHIVSFLAAFDDLIRNNTRRIVILEDMARRIYQEWFVRFRHPTCEGRPLIGSELGPIPQDWEVVSLGAICDHGGEIKTGPFGSQLHQSDYKTEGVPVVMPTNLILGRVDPVGIARIGEEKWRQLTRHHLKAGDIVYGRRGDIGRKALIGEDQEGWLCGTGCIRLSVRNDRLSAIYLSHFLDLDSVKQNIAARAVGSTMPNLNTSIMENTLILVPPTALQREFARSATNTDKLVRCLLAQNRNLRTQRDLLLPKLISGAIDVSEAEELLEAAE